MKLADSLSTILTVGVTTLILGNVTIAYCSDERVEVQRAGSLERQAINLTLNKKEEVRMKRQFFIAGVQFRPRAEINAAADQMKVGDKLALTPEPSNKFDPNAVQISKSITSAEGITDFIFLGYVPKKFSSEVSALLGIDAPVICIVDEVNPAAKTYEMFKVTVAIPIEEEEAVEDTGEDNGGY